MLTKTERLTEKKESSIRSAPHCHYAFRLQKIIITKHRQADSFDARKKNIHNRRRQSFSVIFLIPLRGHVSPVLHSSIHFTRALEFIVLSVRVFVRLWFSFFPKKKWKFESRNPTRSSGGSWTFSAAIRICTGQHRRSLSSAFCVSRSSILFSNFSLFNVPSMSHQLLLLLSPNIITYYWPRT